MIILGFFLFQLQRFPGLHHIINNLGQLFKGGQLNPELLPNSKLKANFPRACLFNWIRFSDKSCQHQSCYSFFRFGRKGCIEMPMLEQWVKPSVNAQHAMNNCPQVINNDDTMIIRGPEIGGF